MDNKQLFYNKKKVIIPDISKFDSDQYFKEYHKYEEYKNNMIYTPTFELDFGKGLRRYKLILYEISDNNNTKLYVVVKEILSEDDKLKLIPHCQCDYHTSSIFNINSYFYCKCCVGCVDSDNPSQIVIDKSRHIMNKIKMN